MTVNVQGLEQSMKDAKIGKGQMAAAIGIDQATFYRKMQSNGEKITVGEMHKMIGVLEMSVDHAASIFLFENSQ